ncbi:MAG: hypothetical protein P8O20_08830 [Bacteroidia bacterium]|nr:hypothetical protein [Bacteroidia bacterium]
MKKALFIIAAVATTIISCSKTTGVVNNPYDNIIRDTDTFRGTEPSATSLEGIHRNVFIKTCANSGCHDGTFEPDFRTAESSFNTLINQAPIKPDPLQTFEYRVVPGNADASMLIHRMTVDLGGNSGIMPLIVNPDNDYPIHKDKHIQNIKDWINAGAPDLDGNTRTAADFPPQILGVNARNGGVLQNRGGKYEPILVDANTNLTLWFSLTDDKLSQDQLSNMKIMWSINPADYTQATFEPLTKSPGQNLPGLYTGSVNHQWSYSFNTVGYASGEVIWFRMSCDDGVNLNYNIPNENSMFFLKKYFAIKIK